MILLLSLYIISQSSPGLEFLRMGTGSRPLALGNAYVSIGDEPFTIFYNPGGIASIKSKIISTFYSRWFLDTELGGIAGVLSVGEKGALGFGLRGLYTDRIEHRTEEDPWSYTYYNSYFLNPSVNYSYRFNNFGLGLGLNGLGVKIASDGKYTLFLNSGVRYTSKKFAFGLAISNLGLRIFNTNLPLSLRTGLCLKPVDNLCFTFDILKVFKDQLTFYAGTEFSAIGPLTLRLGYNPEVYSQNFLRKISGGFGLKIGNITIDYTAASFGIFGLTHNLTVSYNTAVQKKKIRRELLSKEKILMSETYLRQGIEYFNQQKYDEALNAWDLSLIWNPDNQEVLDWVSRARKKVRENRISSLLTRGRNKFNQGDYLGAIYDLQRVLDLDSSLTEAKKLKVSAEYQLKQGIPQSIKANMEKALLKYKNGDYLSAIKIWNSILKIQPENLTVKNYINEANQKIVEEIKVALEKLNNYLSQGKLKSAIDFVNRMLRKYPKQENLTRQKIYIDQKISDSIDKLLAEGRKLYNDKDYVSAEKKFQGVLELEPSNPQALQYLDRIKNKLARGKKEDAERYYLLGIDAYTRDNFELAIKYWNKVLSIDPNYPNVKKNLTRAKIKLEELNR